MKAERYLSGCREGWSDIVRRLRFASYAKASEFYAVVDDMLASGQLTDSELAFLGANDRFFLTTVILRRGDARHAWLYERCREVEADPDNHLDLWAREHYKSTFITFAGTFAEIIADPEITIGIFSVTKEVARPFLAQIMEECESNELLPTVYADVFWQNPRREAPSWSVDDGIIVKRKSNPKECTVEAHGVILGMPTGRHFRLRKYDDLINEKYTSPDMIKKSTVQWEMSRYLAGGERREQYAGTRYNFGDTYGIMLSRRVVKERVHPATDNGALNGKPVLLTQKDWDKLKNAQRSTVAAQMLQDPLAGEENTFRADWLRPYWVRPMRLNVYIIGDPSKGRSASSDRTALLAIGVDPLKNRYLLDGFCHRMKLSERWQNLRHLWLKWSKAPGVLMTEIGYEQYGLVTDIEYFEERAEIERIERFPQIKELNWARDAQTQSKKDRVERLEPYFRQGTFLFPAKVHVTQLGTCRWLPSVRGRKPEYEALEDGYLHEHEAGVISGDQRHRLIVPIRRRDQDNQPYDLTDILMEEYCFFPFAPRDDAIDACSRTEDMDVQPPVIYDEATLAPMEAEDA